MWGVGEIPLGTVEVRQRSRALSHWFKSSWYLITHGRNLSLGPALWWSVLGACSSGLLGWRIRSSVAHRSHLRNQDQIIIKSALESHLSDEIKYGYNNHTNSFQHIIPIERRNINRIWVVLTQILILPFSPMLWLYWSYSDCRKGDALHACLFQRR